ncbi:D-lactaldehyde dehydrogenase [Mycena olivaceomarginata]|nr:D-lactaldehyde dehydrogenase [Mycena olivaceomarginata]
MPAISSGKVLVSGANGFLATWLVRYLLEAGFAVRGAVRSPAKGAHLLETFAQYGDRFELVVVPDITKDGAYDEAVEGVDAIEHTASPFHLDAADPDELIVPAVQGTVEHTSKCAHPWSVKRIVMTSSSAAVLQIQAEPKTFSELDWNEQAPREAAEMGRAAPAMTKYRASKALSERAAWDFVERHKGELHWDLVVLNPSFIYGPTIHPVPTPARLNTSARQFHTIFAAPADAATLRGGACWVDVRDLARAHVLALLKAEAGGERIIVSAGAYVWQEWLDAAPRSSKYQKGIPGAAKGVVHQIEYDVRKSVRVLGMAYRGMEETARDTVADWEARGVVIICMAHGKLIWSSLGIRNT